MENIPKATHPVIQLAKAYLVILFFAVFFMGISIANTAHQPGDQTPLLIYIYALIIGPSLGGVISLYLLIIEKDKNRRWVMLAIVAVHLAFIWQNLIAPSF